MRDEVLAMKCAELEEKIRLLTLENDHLAERAEETLLLGLIAEKVYASADVDELITVALEQVAVLRGIPYVGCYASASGQAWLVHEYAFAPVAHPAVQSVTMAPGLLKAMAAGGCTLQGPECAQFELAARTGSHLTPHWFSLQPLRNRQGRELFLVFATEDQETGSESMRHLLPRVSEMIATRLENLELLDQLTQMNENLDQKVHERTAELRASENRLRTLFEGSIDACLVVDHSLAIRDVNRQACVRLGFRREELVGLGAAEIGFETNVEFVHQLASGENVGAARTMETRLHRQDGTTFPVEVRVSGLELDGEPMMLVQARDVSERDRLLDQLHQAQKMEAVGRLAGGIAHDFNNILTAIMGQLDLLAMDFVESSAVSEDLALIRRSSERAAGLTRQLLAFSRKQVLDMGPQNLSRCVAASARMLERVVAEAVELVWDLDEDAGWVFGDAIQLEQILMNLVVNARDAVSDRGRITISTRRVAPQDGYLVPHAEAPAPTGNYLMLSVEDTGDGIPPEIQEKIFEPFFTTKEVGQGTGLGLALVYSLAQQHQARIIVKSEPGCGTRFDVIFPEIAEPVTHQQGQKSRTVPRGRETVLLVEDDQTIRTVLTRMIKSLGYELLVAEDGVDGLSVAEAYVGNIDLVLSDVVMPRMGGAEMVAELTKHRGPLRIIYMSGYTDDMLGRQELTRPGTRFVQKPVSFAVLGEELRAALDQPWES